MFIKKPGVRQGGTRGMMRKQQLIKIPAVGLVAGASEIRQL